MTNDGIGKCLKYFVTFKNAVLSSKDEIEIKGYRRKEKFKVNDGIKVFIDIMDSLKNSVKDKEVLKVFEYCYEKNLKDKEILNKMLIVTIILIIYLYSASNYPIVIQGLLI